MGRYRSRPGRRPSVVHIRDGTHNRERSVGVVDAAHNHGQVGSTGNPAIDGAYKDARLVADDGSVGDVLPR
jgi:hypothetical protein